MKKILWLIFLLALFLRLFRVGQPVLKEDEFTTVKAAAYIYRCQINKADCLAAPGTLKDRFLALLTANETKPNFGAEIYFWDFIKDKASGIHNSRAWPHLYLAAAVYHFLGINEFSSRLISVIAGSLIVFTGYWFSRNLGSSVKLSLLYSALLAFAFPLIDFSRNARFYSLYSLVFLLALGLVHKSKWWLALPFLLLAYWLQMLTLILPIALLVWGGLTRRNRLAGMLIGGLGLIIGLSMYFKVDFFGRQFLGLAWPPHWFYLSWWWLAAVAVLAIKRERYLLLILGIYLLILTFFTRPDPAGAYVLALWPLSLWALLNWQRWLTAAVTALVLLNFVSKINYLYFGRDGRAQIISAYQAINDNYNPGDKIYAVQLRDYYLQSLPPETPVIDLDEAPQVNFTGSGFIVWEEEKFSHFQPGRLDFIRSNFKSLSSNGVEIYSFGK